MTATTEDRRTIVLYGEPGCSGCLRMKEFVEHTGLPFVWVNVDESLEDRRRLEEADVKVPVVSVDQQSFVNGIDLVAVARLLGVAYDPPAILPPAELVAKYRVVNAALCRFVMQLSDEQLAFSLPGRSRPALQLATHAASAMRVFVGAYYENQMDLTPYREQPEHIRSARDVVDRAVETLEQLEKWWELDGVHDPLDTIIETHYGFRTTLEVLEREVWHTAQHTRQVMLVVESFGIVPDQPLQADDLAGLPLPERVHD